MSKSNCLQNGYVRCPHCGHLFKDHKIERYSIGAVCGTGKLIGHVGFRMIGGTLGVTVANLDVGQRLGGKAADYLFGKMNDMEFVQKKKCPRCGFKFK